VCMSVIGHILPVSRNLIIFVMSVLLANRIITTFGSKNVLLSIFFVVCRWEGLYWMGWSVCNCIEMNMYSYIRVGKNPYPQDVS
jgi:hypothetical protein